MKSQRIQAFETIFGSSSGAKTYYSPGRVNLIGEHIDYNGGLVFPAAISIGTYGVAKKRLDRMIRLYSANYPEQGIVCVFLDDLSYQKHHGWANYAKGIVLEMMHMGHKILTGFDLFVEGNLPPASGLSSSASLEVLVSFIVNDLYDLNISRVSLALLSQKVENTYMGMHCGIMDQLIIACGIKDKALLMNTATLDMVPTDATFSGYKILIMNTNYPRKTTDSKYNERVKECNQSLSLLKLHYPIKQLCELVPESLENIQNILNHDVLFRRTRHVVTEQQRTKDAMAAMNEKDVLRFGKILDQSHQSLKDDYEVTGLHLDVLVESARHHGAIGARVTGAGFGGCAIALVKIDQMDTIRHAIGMDYEQKTGLKATFYDVDFTDGVGGIDNA